MKIINVFALIFSILIIFSCSSRKKIIYLDNQKADSTYVYNIQPTPYKITAGDILYINLYSVNSQVTEYFNRKQSANAYSMWNSEANVYINGYTVNDSGFIALPIIGSINVNQLTEKEATDKIQHTAENFIKNVTAIVKLINFRFTVLGEVRRPGTYTNYNKTLTIFQAIGKAGDLAENADKTRVKLLRKINDSLTVIPLDLTKAEIITSKAYILQPGDVIYVEPIKNKIFKQNIPLISLFFSSVTTLILVLNYLKYR